MANRINFQVGYSVDKSGLQEMQSLFQQIANKAKEPGAELNSELQKAANTANTLDGILEKTFNTNLGTLNVTKFNQELSKSGLTLKSVQADFAKAGSQGVNAYNRLAQAVLGTNLQLKESNRLLDSMATTMANTVKWGITSSIFNSITNSIQKAYVYSKQLDTSLNDIRIVTDKSADSMERFAEQANQASKQMGASTLDYTNAALIYYQQGLSDEEVAARAETTIKAANVTGQTGEAVSEQLTAVWNGYKATAQETELYIDKLAAVAATTAADLEELSVGMSKVASAANSMGVDFDDLNAQIATIVSVTRQAPESVGTALKTIYARLGDLKVDGIDEFGTKLGEVSSQMQSMGIQILDQNGDLRNMSSVIAEVADKWDTWTGAQRQAAAVAMAGKRQYNNLIALFDNWDMYTDALNTSVDAMGTLQHQQDIYMESTSAKLKTLKATWQDLYDGIIDQDELNTGIDALTNLVQVFDNFIDSFGGGIKSIGAFGAIVANIFNKQIANAINGAIQNQQKYQQNVDMMAQKLQIIQQGALNSNVLTGNTVVDAGITANTEKQLTLAKEIYDVRVGLNSEEYNILTNYQQEIGLLEEQLTKLNLITEREAAKTLISPENVAKLKEGVSAADLYDKKFGDLLDKNSKLLKIITDETSNLKIANTYAEDLTDSAHNILIAVKQNDSIYQKLTQKERLTLTTLLDTNKVSENITTSRKQLEQIMSRIKTIAKEEESTVEKEYQQASALEQRYQEIADIKARQNNVQFQFNELKDAGSNAEIIVQKVTSVTSALSSAAMAWSSINSLFQTWNDETISFGDKITQTLMTVGMTLPMIISSFSKLRESLGATSTVWEVITAVTAKHKAEIAANTAAQMAANPVTATAISLEEAKAWALESGTIATEKEFGATTLKQYAEYKAAAATEAHTAAQTALNASMLANPIVILVAALAGLVAITATVIKVQEEQLNTQIKINNETMKASQEKIDEAQANIDLYNSYLQLNAEVKNNSISHKNFVDSIDETLKAVDKEAYAIGELTGDYEALTQSIQKARREQLEDQRKEAINNLQSAQNNILPQGRLTDSGSLIGDIYQFSSNSGIINEKYDKEAQKYLKKYVTDSYINPQTQNLISLVDANDTAAIVEQYHEIEEAIKAMEATEEEGGMSNISRSKSEVYNNAKKYLEDMKDVVEAYEKSTQQLNDILDQIEATSNNNVDFLDAIANNSLKSFDMSREALMKALGEQDRYSGKSNEELKQIANNLISTLGEDAVAYLDKLDIVDGLVEKFGEQYHSALTEIISNISDEEKSILQTLIDGDEDLNFDQLENYIAEAKRRAREANIASDLLTLRDVGETISGGKSLDKDQAEALTETLERLKSEYPELTKQVEILSDAWMQGTQEYADALTIIENKLTNLDINNAIQDASDALDDLDEYLTDIFDDEEITFLANDEDIEDFKDKLDSYIDAEKVIDVKIHADAENNFNAILDTFSDIEKAASKIGKNFVIASNDIRELNQVFPGILEGMTQLENGSYRLSETVVKNAVEAARAEAQADAESIRSRMQDQSTLLHTKASVYEKMAHAAAVLAEQEIDSEMSSTEARKALSDGLAQLQQINSDLTATKEDEDQIRVADSAKLNSEIVSQNWAGSAAASAQSIYEFAENAIANMHQITAASNGDTGAAAISPHVKGSTWTGSSGQSVEGSILKETQQALDNELTAPDIYKDLADKYQQLADETEAAANDIDGMLAQIGAEANNIGAGLNSIANGQGWRDNNDAAKGGGKSGGGGGAKKEKEEKEKEEKEREPKEFKNFDDEFDRYWQIKKAIDAIDKAIKKLEKDQENLYGYQLIDFLKQENKLLERQKANYDALITAQQQEARELRDQLGAMGVIFDASGAIVNYAEATANALVAYNDAIQQYNAGLIDETTLGVYEKSFENFKKLLDRYDELYYTEIQDTKEKMDEIIREQLANNLKAWEVEIELKLNLKELKRGWTDFLAEINEDFKKVYKDLRVEAKRLQDDAKTYIGDDGSITTTINAIHEVTSEIDKMRAGGTSDMFESISQAQEKLKELNDTLQENARGLHDLWKEAWDVYLEGIDQVADNFDDLMGQFERVNDELAFQGQIIELLYGDKAYDLMDALYKGQEKSLENQISSLKQEADMWEQLWRESGATLDNQSDWTEDQKKYYEQWTEAQDDLNDLVIDYIKLLKEDYLNTVNQVLDDLEKSLTGGSSLKDMKTEWERITAYSDKYLDDVEQAYEAQKLANKIDQSIASASNLKNQQKLQALRDKEIKYLREKEHLTQYDLDAAESRYQIALKEMALEDARNNKTSMKLVRNEQGNWSYQYLADEEDVITKQQDLLDAYNNLYQLASDAYEKNLEALQDLQEKYLESAKEIYLDETLSEEEKEQKLLELREWYFEQYGLLAEENTILRNDLASSSAMLLLGIYKQDKEAYEYMTDEEKRLVDELVKNNIEDYADLQKKLEENYGEIGEASEALMESTRLDWTSSAQTLADAWNADKGGSVKQAVLDAHGKISAASDAYQEKVDAVAEVVERDFGEEGIKGAIDDAADSTDDLKEKTGELATESVESLGELKEAVEEIESAWGSVEEAIEDAISTLEEYINAIERASEAISEMPSIPSADFSIPEMPEPTPAPTYTPEPTPTPTPTPTPSSGGGGGSGGGGTKTQPEKHLYEVTYRYQNSDKTESKQFTNKDDALAAYNGLRQTPGIQAVNLIQKYDTGGYTGDWNSYSEEGRLAVLHEKELVLNKDDTKNFLSGISMLRDMTNLNGSISGAIMKAVANMASGISNFRANTGSGSIINETSSSGGDIFNITAEFPNANDVNEIREALLGLPNLASQYIARNQR